MGLSSYDGDHDRECNPCHPGGGRQRSLTVKNMSPKTIKTYMEAVTGLDRFLASKGMPRSADAIKREHVEAFVNDLLERWIPATNRCQPRRQLPPRLGGDRGRSPRSACV
jgi:Phage integrase, N-terminal SAM-like domain